MIKPYPKPVKSEKKPPKPLKRTPIKKKYKVTGELLLFISIFETRPHFCEWCGAKIHEFNVSNFHHEKPKSKFPELRLDPLNIRLICFQCHFNAHNKGKSFIKQIKDAPIL